MPSSFSISAMASMVRMVVLPCEAAVAKTPILRVRLPERVPTASRVALVPLIARQAP